MLYKKVMSDIREKINSDKYAIGELLPTEKELIQKYEVSRITIRKAIDQLAGLNLVEKRQGAGTFVINKEFSHEIRSLKGTAEYLEEANREIQYRVHHFSLIAADATIANRLKIEEGDELYYIRRVKIIDDISCIVEDSFMPVSLFPELNIFTLRRSKFYFVEKEKGFEIEGSLQEFAAVNPEQEIIELLELDNNEPVMKLTSTSNLVDGRYFDYTIAWFKPEAYKLSVYLKR